MKKRLLAILLTAAMLLTLLPTAALAANTDETADSITAPAESVVPAEAAATDDSSEATYKIITADGETLTLSENSESVQLGTGSLTEVNSLYEDVLTEADISEDVSANEDQADPAENAGNRFTTVDEAGSYLRTQMKLRNTAISLQYETSAALSDSDFKEFYDAAVQHTGVPDEGDYLAYQCGGYSISYSYSYDQGNFLYSITYSMDYYTDADQEAVVTETVGEILESLELSDKTEYEKIRSIYDYITSHVFYDYSNAHNDTYKLKYTAYSALAYRYAVCQGYAVLLYRMLLEEGIDCRVIDGLTVSGAHSWNIARIGSLYYNLDATWDAGQKSEAYSYFLKNPDSFADHTRNDSSLTDAFTAAYPMSETDYPAPGINDVKYISTPEELLAIADAPSGNYALAMDLDLSDVEIDAKSHAYITIRQKHGLNKYFSDDTNYFSGTLDGNGHSISGMQMALFDMIGETGSIENTKFVYSYGSETTASGMYYGLARINSGVVKDCTIVYTAENIECMQQMNFVPYPENYGEINHVDLTITLRNITIADHYLVMGSFNYGVMKNCNVYGSVDLNCPDATIDGGLLTRVNRGIVENCTVYADVSIQANDFLRYGNLAGYSIGLMSECCNYGSLNINTSTSDISIGGLCGSLGYIMDHCTNAGNITVSGADGKSVGALVGTATGRLSMSDCKNTGTFSCSGSIYELTGKQSFYGTFNENDEFVSKNYCGFSGNSGNTTALYPSSSNYVDSNRFFAVFNTKADLIAVDRINLKTGDSVTVPVTDAYAGKVTFVPITYSNLLDDYYTERVLMSADGTLYLPTTDNYNDYRGKKYYMIFAYTADGKYDCALLYFGDHVTKTEVFPASDSPFADVRNSDNYFYEPVLWAAENGIVYGTSVINFSPYAVCTRAQVVTFLYRTGGEPAITDTTNPFTDVKPGDYYYDAVLWGYQNGIVYGTSDTTFSPEDKVTRAQFITFLHRFAKEPAVTDRTSPFIDLPAGEYYTDAVLWGYQNGIVYGVEDNKFAPNDTCTRAQVVTFLHRYKNPG